MEVVQQGLLAAGGVGLGEHELEQEVGERLAQFIGHASDNQSDTLGRAGV